MLFNTTGSQLPHFKISKLYVYSIHYVNPSIVYCLVKFNNPALIMDWFWTESLCYKYHTGN